MDGDHKPDPKFQPYFKWTEFVFGHNLMAATAQMVGVPIVIAIVFAIVRFAIH